VPEPRGKLDIACVVFMPMHDLPRIARQTLSAESSRLREFKLFRE
jgi:hypothetical protein